MLLYDIAGYLEARGFGVQGTDLFCDYLPETPHNCITLFGYGGAEPDLHWPGEYPSFQVRVRNVDYDAGWGKVHSIYQLLNGLAETVIGTTRYLLIAANQSPFVLMQDENKRWNFIVNFRTIKETD